MAYQKISFFDAIGANKRNSILLLLAIFFFFLIVIAAFSYAFDLGGIGIFVGFFALLFYALVSYFAGDKAILSMSNAQPLDEKKFPFVYNVVEGLSIAAGIPMPKLYIIEDPSPNAFAIGRDPKHASIAVTRGLLENMKREELEGVLAHEISHIANYDVRYILIAIVFAGAIALIADFTWRSMRFRGGSDRRSGNALFLLIAVLLIVLAPIFAELIRLALSRQREYLADANGAKLTRYPAGLANALEKIAKFNQPVAVATDATAPLYFANPLPNKFAHFFSTHPPAEERVKRLRSM
ncbi:MAG TPA: M48 family metallopeptidase [Candidatus Bilamarchaeaceae archaeon]|nr:M48 family metallopeptidase [Candidatus Bilamarchaeaceae archaeon]